MELNKTTIFIFYEQMKNKTEQFLGDNWGQKHGGRMRKSSLRRDLLDDANHAQ
jgi:hypothetical protein